MTVASKGAASFSSGLRGGAIIAFARLRSRSFGVSFALASALTIVGALVERRMGPSGAVDRSLGLVFSWVIPLLTLATLSVVVGPRSLRDATWPIARFGAPRALCALGVVGATMAACALASVVLTLLAVTIGHAPSSAPLLGDLATSAWISGLTGSAYAAFFAFGATLGRAGGGRSVILALDFVLGRTELFGVVLPRGNAANLIGVGSSLEASQRTSSILLVGVAVFVALIATWRSRD